MDQLTVSSVIDGRAVAGAPGGRIWSTNPARLDEVIADVALGDAELLVTAARAAGDAQRAWADVPAPVRGKAIAHIGRLVEDNKQALATLVTREFGKLFFEEFSDIDDLEVAVVSGSQVECHHRARLVIQRSWCWSGRDDSAP